MENIVQNQLEYGMEYGLEYGWNIIGIWEGSGNAYVDAISVSISSENAFSLHGVVWPCSSPV